MAKYSISQQATVGRRRKSLILLGLQQAAVGVHGFKPIVYPILPIDFVKFSVIRLM